MPLNTQGSIEISTNNLEGLLQLADALLMDELRELCVSAALDSLPAASRAWAASMHSLGIVLGVSKLTERALGQMAYHSLDSSSWLDIFAKSLASYSSSPSAQLAAIYNGLSDSVSREGDVVRLPTSVIVALLLRVDQLTDIGQPSSEERQRRKRPRPASPAPAAALDVAALLREVNFNRIQPAEHRALSVMATNCSKETPALSLLMRRLLQRESGELPAHEAVREAYQLGTPGTWVAGTLDLSADYWTNPGPIDFDLPLSDIPVGSNKLFGSEEGAGHAARFIIQHFGTWCNGSVWQEAFWSHWMLPESLLPCLQLTKNLLGHLYVHRRARAWQMRVYGGMHFTASPRTWQLASTCFAMVRDFKLRPN